MDGDFRATRWSHGIGLLNQRVCRLQDFSSDLLPDFAYYRIQTALDQIHTSLTGSTVKHLSSRELGKARIPIPPLEVQREIVRILDAFTELEAELEAELAARRKQYEHYRDELLEFSGQENIEWIRFGDKATIVRGASPRPIQNFLTTYANGVNWIKIGDVPADGKYIETTAERITPAGALKSRSIEPGDFVLSNSMSFGRPYISQIEGCIHDGWLAIKDFTETYTPDFLYHLLRSTMVFRMMASRAGASTVKNLNADIVKGLELPAPRLSTQRQIADTLDKFDALVNDISIGLPAELAARRKQYEYYRNKLLTFEEKR